MAEYPKRLVKRTFLSLSLFFLSINVPEAYATSRNLLEGKLPEVLVGESEDYNQAHITDNEFMPLTEYDCSDTSLSCARYIPVEDPTG